MMLAVGRVLRPHGVGGEVAVEICTDEPERRFAPGTILVVDDPAGQAGRRSVTVAGTRAPHRGRVIVELRDVPDRAAAEELRGVLLRVDSDRLTPPADPDEFHDHQLVGLVAVSPTGETLGEVVGVDHAPAADRLRLARPDGRTALVPFVRAIVPEVDPAVGRVVVDAPPGLLDL